MCQQLLWKSTCLFFKVCKYATKVALSKPNKDVGKYLLPLRCCFLRQETLHDQQGKKGPEGTLLGCETEPPCRFVPSQAPRTLKHQPNHDPVLLLISIQASLYFVADQHALLAH